LEFLFINQYALVIYDIANVFIDDIVTTNIFRIFYMFFFVNFIQSIILLNNK